MRVRQGKMHPMLSDYQVDGVRMLVERKRTLLADYMGLGKTFQTIAACDYLGLKRILLVVPKTLITNWIREVERFSEGTEIEVLTTKGDMPDTRMVITNYETLLRRDVGKNWDCLIVDEFNKIVNRKAKRSIAVKKLSAKIPYVWMLSGTLTRNKPDDIWMPLSCVAPRVFSSYWKFREQHCTEEVVHIGGGRTVRKVVGIRDEKAFRAVIEPYVIQRSLDVLDLPAVVSDRVFVGMTIEQKSMYWQMQQYMSTILPDDSLLNAPNALSRLIRSRQICLDPRLVGGRGTGGKTLAMLEMLEPIIENYKVAMFTMFAKYAGVLENTFNDKLGDVAVKLVGKMNVRERAEAVDAFKNDDGCRILVASMEIGGEGLNLQEADIIVFADLPWTPATVNQVIGRSQRRGREDTVYVLYVLTEGTVEEYVYDTVVMKQKVLGAIDLVKAIRHQNTLPTSKREVKTDSKSG